MRDNFDRLRGIQEIVTQAYEEFDVWDQEYKELQAFYAGQLYKAIESDSPAYPQATQEIQKHQRLFAIVLQQWWAGDGNYGVY